MNQEQHERLRSLISDVEGSQDARAKFLENPLGRLQETLALDEVRTGVGLPIANVILTSLLRSPDGVEAVSSAVTRYQAGEISIEDARSATAEALVQSAPPDVRDEIRQWVDQHRQTPGLEDLSLPPSLASDPGNPQAFPIANIAVALDIAVVATETAVVHSTVFFSGRDRGSIADIRRLSAALTRP